MSDGRWTTTLPISMKLCWLMPFQFTRHKGPGIRWWSFPFILSIMHFSRGI